MARKCSESFLFIAMINPSIVFRIGLVHVLQFCLKLFRIAIHFLLMLIFFPVKQITSTAPVRRSTNRHVYFSVLFSTKIILSKTKQSFLEVTPARTKKRGLEMMNSKKTRKWKNFRLMTNFNDKSTKFICKYMTTSRDVNTARANCLGIPFFNPV